MRIVIVEDEAVLARRLARLVRDILGPDADEPVIARDIDAARAALSVPPRLLLLDLNLEGDDGFTLLRESVCGPYDTIVVSAHRERAIEAFELGVRDFVAKPYSRERLEQALRRTLAPPRRAETPIRFLGVRRRGGIDFVAVRDVAYIRGAGTASELVLHDGERIVHDKLLDHLESFLPTNFERIHRSYIVDLRRAARLVVREGSRYALVLRDGTTLPVGRTRVAALRARLA